MFSRRRFLASSAVAGAGIITGRDQRAFGFKSANDRPRMAVVGCGSRWDQRSAGIPDGPWGSGKFFPLFADIVHVCDVDAAGCRRTCRGKHRAGQSGVHIRAGDFADGLLSQRGLHLAVATVAHEFDIDGVAGSLQANGRRQLPAVIDLFLTDLDDNVVDKETGVLRGRSRLDG